MAEIKIEKKTPIWPWIIGLLVVGLILYFFVFKDDTVDELTNTQTNTEEIRDKKSMERSIEPIASVDEINSYNEYISHSKMGLDHEFTHEALSKLISTTQATAVALNINVDSELIGAKTKTDEIIKDSTSLTHANKIKDVATSISHALKTIQTEKYPQLESNYKEVETAVSKIKVDTPTLDQKDDIKEFLRKSGNLLTSIRNDYGQAR